MDAKCNGRKKGHPDVPQVQPGPDAGEWYCSRQAGWGTSHKCEGRCKQHGGNTPRGIASPHFKHGIYSKAMPVKLRGQYEEAMQDPELLSLREEAGLLKMRMQQLISSLETGEAGQIWMKLRGMAMYMQQLLDESDEEGQDLLLKKMLRTIEAGASEYLAWRNIVSMTDNRRKVVESERRRLVDLQQYMTREQVLTQYAALLYAVRNRVKDPETLRLIQQDFDDIQNRPADGPAAG